MRSALFAVLVGSLTLSCGVRPFPGKQLPVQGTMVSGAFSDDVTTGDLEAGPYINLIEPSSGRPDGGDLVHITGGGFVQGARVWFGLVESGEVHYESVSSVFALSPPHVPGFVDVSIEFPGGEKVLVPDGFLYSLPLMVEAVEPAAASVTGGAALTISGSGFLPGTRCMLGDGFIEGQRVVSSSMISGTVPPSSAAGAVAVSCAGPAAVVRVPDAFIYTVAPALESVEPRVTPAGGRLMLRGKFLSSVKEVRSGAVFLQVVKAGPAQMEVQLPWAMEEGGHDLVVSGAWGSDYQNPAFFVSNSQPAGEISLLGLIPDAVSTSGGEILAMVCGASAAAEFILAGVAIEVLSADESSCTFALKVPSSESDGPVDLLVKDGGLERSFDDALERFHSPSITSLEPAAGPENGGSTLVATGAHLDLVSGLRLGTRYCGISSKASDRLEFVTPPGGPGVRDLVLETPWETRRFGAAWTYIPAKAALVQVEPSDASMSGGALVRLSGAGFTESTKVLFGDREVPVESLEGNERIWIRTPQFPFPQKIDVSLDIDGHIIRYPIQFTVFDPIDWGNGGIWGGPYRWDLNVAVLEPQDRDPVSKAVVILESIRTGRRMIGETDRNGMITFSERDLAGPFVIHASRRFSEASTIAGTYSRNNTLWINVPKPQDPGNGDPEDPPPDGYLSAKILDAEKYSPVPAGDCGPVFREVTPFCAPCLRDDDCGAGAICADLDGSGRFCTRGCADISDCPERFICASSAGGAASCRPLAGTASIRCLLSEDGTWQAGGQQEFARNLDGSVDVGMVVSPGERALACFLGYEAWDTGDFVPQALALRRHITVYPGAGLSLPPLLPSHVLDLSIPVRMKDPPAPQQPLFSVRAFLDLGSDGYLPWPGGGPPAVIPELAVNALPEVFDGDLEGVRLLVFGNVMENNLDQNPISTSVARLDSPAPGPSVFTFGASAPAGLDLAFPVFSACTGSSGEVLLFGASGRMSRINGSGAAVVLGSPLRGDLVACGAAGDSVYVIGGGGALLELKSDGEAALLGSLDLEPPFSAAGNPSGLLAVAGNGRLVLLREGALLSVSSCGFRIDDVAVTGERVFVISESAGLWSRSFEVEDWTSHGLPEACGRRVLALLKDGSLLIAGSGRACLLESGGYRVIDGAAGDWVAAGGSNSGNFWLAERRGRILKQTGGTLHSFVRPPNLEVFAVAGWGYDTAIIAGRPVLELSPVLHFPRLEESVFGGGKFWQSSLHWSNGGGPAPDFHALYFVGAKGNTVWRVYAHSQATSFEIPDFSDFGFNPFSPRPLSLTIYSISREGFSFSDFGFRDLSSSYWSAWTWADMEL